MAVRRGGSETDARSGVRWAAAWIGVLAVFTAMLGGVSVFGVVEPFDVPQLAAAVAALGLAVGVSRPLRRLWRSTQARRVEVPALALLVVVAVSALRATDPATALLGAPGSGLGAFAVVMLLLLGLSAAWLAPQVRSSLTLAAPWMIAAQAVVTVFQMATNAAARGTFSSAAYLSMALVVLVPPTLAPVVAGGRLRYDRPALARLALAALAVVLLGLSGARVGTAVALAGVAWMLTPAMRALSKNDRRVVPAVAGAVVLTVSAMVLVALRPFAGQTVAQEVGTRLELWAGSLRLVAMRPLLGWGPDGFHAAIGRVATAAMMASGRSAAHGFAQLPTDPDSILLAALVSLGVVGLAALAWASTAVVRTWLGERRSSGRLAWPAVSTLLFVATAMVEPATLQNLPLFALVAGASIPLGYLRPEAVESRRTLTTTAGASAAFLTRTIATVATLVVAASAATHLWVGAIGTSADVASSLRARQAAQLWQVDPFLFDVESTRWSLAAAGGATSAFAPATTAAQRAVALAPSDPFYLTQYAYTLYVSRQPDKAADAYAAVLGVFPHSPDAVEGAGFSLLAAGRTAQALLFAERALAIGPGRLTAHLLAADVYRALGDTKRADAEAAAAERLLPK